MMPSIWYFVLWQHFTNFYFMVVFVTLPIYFDNLIGLILPTAFALEAFLSLQQQVKGGFLCDFRYHQDGSYPFLIPPASRTGDRVLELLLINIESN
jgi:hypothetical protein